MPSYRYLKDIKPEDLQQNAPPQLDPKEKRKNWWHYQWKIVLVCAIGVLLVGLFIADIVRTEEADVTIGIITPSYMPDDLLTVMEEQFELYADDWNKDKKVKVSVELFNISTSEEQGAAQDPNIQMASVVRMSSALSTGECFIMITDDRYADEYQDSFNIFYDDEDGQVKEDINDYSVALKDIPAFNDMDLTFSVFDGTEIDGKEAIGDFRVNLRPLQERLTEKKKPAARWEASNEFFERIMAGEKADRD